MFSHSPEGTEESAYRSEKQENFALPLDLDFDSLHAPASPAAMCVTLGNTLTLASSFHLHEASEWLFGRTDGAALAMYLSKSG